MAVMNEPGAASTEGGSSRSSATRVAVTMGISTQGARREMAQSDRVERLEPVGSVSDGRGTDLDRDAVRGRMRRRHRPGIGGTDTASWVGPRWVATVDDGQDDDAGAAATADRYPGEPLGESRGGRRRARRRSAPIAQARASLVVACVGGGSVQAYVANLVKAFGQHVAYEATEEFARGDRLSAAPLGAKGHGAIGDGEQSTVGDPHPVRVAPEIGQDVSTAVKRRFGVDDPRLAGDATHQGHKSERVAKVVELGEVILTIGVPQLGHHLAAEDLTECVHREEESTRGTVPVRAVSAQATAGDDGMHVRMVLESARPGVQDQGGAERGAKVASTEGQQRALRGAHQGAKDVPWGPRG